MNRFQAILRHTNERLQLPQATRSRILLEMAGDLEDLYQHYRSEGLDEVEATRRAEEAFAVSDDALGRLVAVHRPALERLTEHLAGGWEKILLGALLAFAVLMGGHAAMASGGFLARAGVFVWPVLALNAVALGIVLAKLHALVVRRGLDVRRLRSGLGGLLFAAAGSLAVGLNGSLVEVFLHLRRFAAGAPEYVLGNCMIRVSALMIVAMVTAILAALAWFVLVRWAARIENRQADELLDAG